MIRENLNKGRLIFATKLLVTYMVYKITNDLSAYYDVVLSKEDELHEEFDAAFAYAGPATIIDYYICHKVRAKEKFGWIHFDVMKFGMDCNMTRNLYREYKKIFVVSEAAKKNFDVVFPEFKDKTEVRYNVVSKKQILLLSEVGETFDDNYDGVRILTVGRLSKEKGQDVTIKVLNILVDRGLNVRWYYVGDGILRQICEQMAQEEGLSDKVSFLGTKANPYGYMRDCDIYVQPSRHEGYCITLAEARCFTAPIVATNFTGAKEQLRTYSHSIVTGMSAEEIAEGVMAFLT